MFISGVLHFIPCEQEPLVEVLESRSGDIGVSVVVPVYQRRRFLQRCFDTLDQQRLIDIEVVFVDDGSTDGSYEMLKKYQKNRPNVRVIRLNKNHGTHYARCRAVLAARGRYVFSLDADDELIANATAFMYCVAEQHQASVVEFDSLAVGHNHTYHFTFMPPEKKHMDANELTALVFAQKLNWQLWRKLIRRSVYLKALRMLGKESLSRRIIMGEDRLHCALIYLFSDRYVYVKKYGYIYYTESPGNSESGSRRKLANNEVDRLNVESTLDHMLRLKDI
jgi:glycosyltransferase involved in cell wall biosynthesis